MQADITNADGMPLVVTAHLFYRLPSKERAAIANFIHDAAQIAVRELLKLYFLGAKPVIAEKLIGRHLGLYIVGAQHGYFMDEEQICAKVRASGAAVLWVGLGGSHQEDFAVRNRGRLSGLACIRTCGGLSDHYAGAVPRVPVECGRRVWNGLSARC